jgi:putative pyruvate formate lyase activating enzyme
MCSFADVFLPDFKYATAENGKIFSNAPNYSEVALSAIKKMVEHTGKPMFDSEGMLIRGTVVRHLVLPGQRKDSIAVMDILGKNFLPDEILVSVMNQYTPQENAEGNLARKVTGFEYNSVVKRCAEYGFDGFTQGAESADAGYTPLFDLTGV